jgi:hypothetical protein
MAFSGLLDELRRHPSLHLVWTAMGKPVCYLVGGFLRDHLLGRTSTDLDLALLGTSEEVAGPAHGLARAFHTRAHLLGQESRSVWRITAADLKVELWPLGSLTLEADILCEGHFGIYQPKENVAEYIRHYLAEYRE